MRDQGELQADIDKLAWFSGDYLSTLWKLVNDGLQDHSSGQLVRGFDEAHVHVVRVDTYRQAFLPQGMPLHLLGGLPLPIKQRVTGELHTGPAFTEANLFERMSRYAEHKWRLGLRECWAIADTVPQTGVRAFNVLKQLKQQWEGRLDIKVGAYPLQGFKEPSREPERLEVLDQALALGADFLVGLPERDDDPERIGFEGHMALLFDRAYKHQIPLQVHVDQMNSKTESGTIRMIRCLKGLLPEKRKWFTESEYPRLWAVHVISPSCYDADEFSALVDDLLKFNIGVIVCPTAAISMRTLRSEIGPIHNSIARVIEMLSAGVYVRIGSDNQNDMFIPSGTGNPLFEAFMLTNVVREYSLETMAKLLMGMRLNEADRSILKSGLGQTQEACAKHQAMLCAMDKMQPRFNF